MRSRQQTIRINQGYRIDSTWEGLALVGRIGSGFVRLVWRWRTETVLTACVLAVRLLLGRHLDPDRANLLTGAVVAVALLWAPWRRLLLDRLSCARTRRRILACLRETRVATTSGRLPLVLRSRRTPAGERLTLRLLPGQSAELLDARVEELRAAARAMDVTVSRAPTRADRVTVEVIRRDLLHPGLILASPLVDLAADLLPAPLASGAVPGAAVTPTPASTGSKEVSS
jgi:hypothetical protein